NRRIVSAAIVLAFGLGSVFLSKYILPVGLITYSFVAGLGFVLLGAMALLLDWGLAWMFFGLFVWTYGIYPGQNDWTSDIGMPFLLFGPVLTLCGWKVIRVAWFPILFLLFAIPWPGLVYSKVASPLQELAAKVAVGVLNITGVESMQAGTKI